MLSLPPLQLPQTAQAYVRGEVTIHPSAAIAPGVILQAEPGSQILIGAGVCIGMGAVLHSYEGRLEIESGANLGAGALIVGQAKIGAGACIGTSATIFNCAIRPGEMVAPGSLIGDTSRQPTAEPPSPLADAAASPAPSQPEGSPTPPLETAPPPATASSSPEPSTGNSQIYGQAYLSELLVTLLPHRQALDQPSPELPPPPNNA